MGHGPVTVTADEALGEEQSDGEDKSQLEEEADWLADFLAQGLVAQREVIARGKHEGFTPRTIQRAKERLGVESGKFGLARNWSWSLPNARSFPMDAKGATAETLANLGSVGTLRCSTDNLEDTNFVQG